MRLFVDQVVFKFLITSNACCKHFVHNFFLLFFFLKKLQSLPRLFVAQFSQLTETTPHKAKMTSSNFAPNIYIYKKFKKK
jgi:hypothetical protein